MRKARKLLSHLIPIFLVVAAFFITYNYILNDLSSVGTLEKAELSSKISTSMNFVNVLTCYGNNFILHNQSEKNTEILGLLQYHEESDSYNLDAAGGAANNRSLGNISGSGSIPITGVQRKELDLAIDYYDYFKILSDSYPDITWLYYTSDHGFVSMYPWFSSKDFSYSEKLRTVEYFSVATPHEDPLRQPVWTRVYMDEAGKGRMVTLSSPLYDNDNFLGVISIDLTTNMLSKMLESGYSSFLIDKEYNVIASNAGDANAGSISKLTEMRDIPKDTLQSIGSMECDSIQRVGMNYFYKSVFTDAPWMMLLTIPVYIVIAKAMLVTIPVMLIGIFLLVSLWEIERRRKAEERIRELAITDALTGLKNRNFLYTIVDTLFAEADRYQYRISVAIFDIDLFKRINDTWGHPVGDEVLMLTCEAVRNNIRKADIPIRLGGEEFLILMPHTDEAGAQTAAEKVRQVIQEKGHPLAGEYTASFGVAERAEGEPFTSLYKRADDALYKAKANGRNRVVVYSEVDGPSVDSVNH